MNKKFVKASLTIEAAFLLPFITMIIILTIYLGLFLYNRCTLSQRTYIETFRGSSMESEDHIITETVKKQVILYSDKYVLGGIASVKEIELNDDRINSIIFLRGNNPFYKNELTKGINSFWTAKIEKEVYRLNHLDFIRNCRRIEEILEEDHESGK